MPKKSRSQNLEDKDKVIDCLLRDPSCSVQTLSERCQLSIQQVYRILRILEEEDIIYGNPLVLNLSKLGMKRYIIFATRSGKPADQTSLDSSLYSEKFLRRIRDRNLDIIPEDDYTCTGAFDMVTIFLAKNIMDANKYLDLIRTVSNEYFSSFMVSEVLFTTRKNMLPTPERDAFVNYMKDISEFGSNIEDPEKIKESSTNQEE